MKLCLLLALLCAIRFADGARILALFPLQTYSHFTIFEGIVKGLAMKGHRVDVVSHFPQKKPFANYTDILDLTGNVPAHVNNMKLEYVEDERLSRIQGFFKAFATDICELMSLPGLQKLIKEPPQDPPYDLVIAEQFFANCYFAFGRHLKVPLVALSSSRLMPYFNAPMGLPELPSIVAEFEGGSSIGMNFWQRLQNTWTVVRMNREARTFTQIQTDMVRKYFGPHMPDIRELERDVSLLLVNSHFSITGIRPLIPAIVEIAGVHIKDDESELPADLKKWLDDSRDGFVYVSFGSMMKIESFSEESLFHMYSAFRRLAPTRILVKIADPTALPPGLPDNVLTMSWIPQMKVLQHKNIRVFMTHGGQLSILEAVTYAVPLVGVPILGDQPLNLRNCIEKGIAVTLDMHELTDENIFTAISTVMNDSKYRQNMKIISEQFRDRPMSAQDTAVYWIEYILKHGPDALRSPAIGLAWWQIVLLDIYASIAAVAILILYISKKIISALFCRLYNPKKKSD